MNGHRLRALFQQFNQQYFGGKLPQYRIHVAGRFAGQHHKARRLIEASDGDAGTLLHEMVHAAIGDHHGKRFVAEILRLHQAGAPVNPADVRFAVENPQGPPRISKDRVTSEFDDLLLDNRKITFAQAVHQISSDSTAEFLRRHPWARRVFSERVRLQQKYDAQIDDFRNRLTTQTTEKG